MAPWIPQNIQKRLLLYVLQQLALFSEIDLPNLEEVSLNSIVLRDVSLDPDKVQIPGANLRYGQVGLFELTAATSSGGVTVDAHDVDVVIALDIEQPGGSLAQSTANLANTMMGWEGEERRNERKNERKNEGKEEGKKEGNEERRNEERNENEEVRKNEAARKNDLSKDSGRRNDKESTLSSVMAKAVEMALSRLSVNIHNLSIKVMTDPELMVKIKTASFKTVNGVRKIDIGDVSVAMVNMQDSDSDSDYSGPMEQSLMDSMVFTHEEASSIYMSATSRSLDIQVAQTQICNVDSIGIDFKGLSSVENLRVDVGNVEVVAASLFPAVCAIVDGLTSVRKERFPQYAKSDEVRDENMFSRLHIESLTVRDETNETNESKPSLSLSVSNINIKSSAEKVCVYGGAEKVAAYSHGRTLFSFASAGAAKADVRFEAYYRPNETEITVLCSKEARVALDAASVAAVLHLSEGVQAVVDSVSRLGGKAGNSHYVFQSSTIELVLEEAGLVCSVSPISYNSRSDETIVKRVEIEKREKGREEKNKKNELNDPQNNPQNDPQNDPQNPQNQKELNAKEVVLSNILILSKLSEFRSFIVDREKAHKASLTSPLSVIVDSVEAQVSLETAQAVGASLAAFWQAVQAVPQRPWSFKKPKRPFHGSLSVHTRRRRVLSGVCTSRVFVKRVFASIAAPLGIFNVRIRDICLKQMHGELVGTVFFADVVRGSQKVVHEYQGKTESTLAEPMVLIREDGGRMEVTLRRFLLEYYGEWWEERRDERDEGKETNTHGICHQPSHLNISSHHPNSHSQSGSFEMRVFFVDCVVGLSPISLQSKAYVVIDKTSVDVTPSYVKATLRGISGFLIDDIANETRGHVPTHTSPRDVYTQRGYIAVASINTVHVGIKTAATLDVKVTSDEQVVEVCADSANCLVSLVQDLRPEERLQSEEKMRVVVDKEINLWEHLEELWEREERGEGKEERERERDDRKEVNDTERKERNDVNDTGSARNDTGYARNDTVSARNDTGYSRKHETEKTDASHSSSSLPFLPSFHEDHFVLAEENTPPPAILTLSINLNRTRVCLFDGYDWSDTREAIRSTVEQMQQKRQERERPSLNDPLVLNPADSVEYLDVGEESDIEELFQSIFLGGGSDMVQAINAQVKSESNVNVKDKRLRLRRSTTNKCVAVLRNVGVVVDVYEREENGERERKEYEERERKEYEERREKTKRGTNGERNRERTGRDGEKRETMKETSTKGREDDRTQSDSVSFDSEGSGPSVSDSFFGFHKPILVSSTELTVETVEVLDNIPTSSWHKVVAYDGSGREMGTQMVRLRFSTYRTSELKAGEAVLKLSVMPLRLYVDQDMLVFLQRFVCFADQRFDAQRHDEEIFFQKVEMDELRLRVDYKPKSVDYVGMRGGQYAELLNFFSLEGSEVRLDRVCVFGLSAAQLGPRLAQVWGDSFVRNRNNKLLKILIGFGLVRSVYNIGGDLRNLVVVPMKSDDKLKAVQKHGLRFLRSAGSELVRLGVKLSTGTQVLLEQGESKMERPAKPRRKKKASGVLESSQLLYSSTRHERNQYTPSRHYSNVDMDDPEPSSEEEETKPVSHYSNQPENLEQGLQHAYAAIGSNVKATKRHVMQLMRELEDAESVQDTFGVLLANSPLLVLRPMIGTTEVVSKVMMGLGNNIDGGYLDEAKQKYSSSTHDNH